VSDPRCPRAQLFEEKIKEVQESAARAKVRKHSHPNAVGVLPVAGAAGVAAAAAADDDDDASHVSDTQAENAPMNAGEEEGRQRVS
jgi:hypothetical protein